MYERARARRHPGRRRLDRALQHGDARAERAHARDQRLDSPEAANQPALRFADTRAAVADPADRDRLAASPDGLHPDIDGYRRMAEALEPAIQQLLSRTRQDRGNRRSFSVTRTADVVIIGGGCMGASVAFHLAASRHHERHPRRARSPARHGFDGTERRRRPPSVLPRRQYRAVDRVHPLVRALRGSGRPARSTCIRTVTCSCSRRRRASPRSATTSRASDGSACRWTGSIPTRPPGSRPACGRTACWPPRSARATASPIPMA